MGRASPGTASAAQRPSKQGRELGDVSSTSLPLLSPTRRWRQSCPRTTPCRNQRRLSWTRRKSCWRTRATRGELCASSFQPAFTSVISFRLFKKTCQPTQPNIEPNKVSAVKQIAEAFSENFLPLAVNILRHYVCIKDLLTSTYQCCAVCKTAQRHLLFHLCPVPLVAERRGVASKEPCAKI